MEISAIAMSTILERDKTYHIGVCDIEKQTNIITEVEASNTLDAIKYCIEEVCGFSGDLPEFQYEWELRDFIKAHGYILSEPYLMPELEYSD